MVVGDRNWPTKQLAVTSLHLDQKNPRLGRETTANAPREIIQHLFEHDKALEVAESIVGRGYFPNEPLLAVREAGRVVVIEGNRRLAALKALAQPGLLEGRVAGRVEGLARRLKDPKEIATVPVTLAPNRRATDRQIAGRHIGMPVLAWQAENRASFILDKLDEGYSNESLRDELGFTLADIQAARQTRAIADMARSLDLPEEVQAKLDAPRAKVFTTLERVFDSSVGRANLGVEPDSSLGLRGKTTPVAFKRAFTRLVSDVALKKVSSRSLNKNEDIEKYFNKWDPADLPAGKHGTFVPDDIIKGRSVSSLGGKPTRLESAKRGPRVSTTVLPKDLKVRVKVRNARLRDLRDELVALDRFRFTNAGTVLLRVFLELAVADYLERTGEMGALVAVLRSHNALKPGATPTMKQMMPVIIRIAKKELSENEANQVRKALTYDRSAPFSISELNGYVHSSDIPTEKDIRQFWVRTEPLFKLMLEQEPSGPSK
jgi:hypothetical protein